MSQEIIEAEAPKPKSLGAQLKERERQFMAALPAHMPAERFMRVIMTAVQNNPSLADADRPSLWNSCMRAAQDGLLPDGRDGALVIYKTKDGDRWIAKVQWMPMIGGIRKKVRNSGEIKDWNAQVVHAKDAFEFELGDEPFIKHRPYLGEGDPGPVVAAYSVAQFKTGEKSREVMTRAQIDKVRNASKSKDKGPWSDWYEEMCRKTVARRHSKVLPMSSDLDDLIRRDDELYDLNGASDKQNSGPKPSLGDRLDALAGVLPAYDQETGEIPQAEVANANEATVDAEAGTNSDGDSPPSDNEGAGAVAASSVSAPEVIQTPVQIDDVIATGEARASAGTKALHAFIEGLSPEDFAIIKDKRKSWHAAALRADAARAAA